MGINDRLTITDVAKELGITPRTIMRWEKAGKIKMPKRDWRGWRFYTKDDAGNIRKFFESAYEYDDKQMISGVARVVSIIICALTFSLCACAIGVNSTAYAKTNLIATPGVTETTTTINIELDKLPVVGGYSSDIDTIDAVKYTLGPNDIISIEVRRHPEFSGKYTINSEGKIEYKFVGDVDINGLTKRQVKDKIYNILSEYLIEPEVDVNIVAYLSKVYYVVGEVGRPGKFFMRGNTVTVQQALFQAGLPTHAAAMRRSRLIAPNDTGKDNYVKIDVFELLYEGDLSHNLVMQPNQVLYVPATVMAKIIRVISPVTNATGQVAGSAAMAAAI